MELVTEKVKKEKTKVGKFLEGLSKPLGAVLEIAGDVTNIGALSKLGDAIHKSGDMSPEEKLEALKLLEEDRKIMELEVEDRKSAREMYRGSQDLQKFFAKTILIGLIVFSAALIFFAFSPTAVDIPTPALVLITSIFTSFSNKVNSIVDFLFGSSFDKNG